MNSADIGIRISSAIPEGEVWLASGCTWRETRPADRHGEPEWRVTGMCVHEHLWRGLLCTFCKETLERRRRMPLNPAPVWCTACYKMRPGGHPCTCAVEIEPLGADLDI